MDRADGMCISSIILSVYLNITTRNRYEMELRTQSNCNKYRTREWFRNLDFVLSQVSCFYCSEEWMFRYTRSAAKKINSGALMADAQHHRPMQYFIGAFVGILSARLGSSILDPPASAVTVCTDRESICRYFKDAMVEETVEYSCDEATENIERWEKMIMEWKEWRELTFFRQWLFGSKMHVDVLKFGGWWDSLMRRMTLVENVHHTIEKV